MANVNVKATFSKDERELNGLAAIADELVDEPLQRRVIVAVIETSSVRIEYGDDGVATPTIRLVNVEALDGADAEQARAMLNARFRRRTGRPEDPQRSLFETDADTDTVEPVRDPDAGPWPGDADFVAPADADGQAGGGDDSSETGAPVAAGRRAPVAAGRRGKAGRAAG